MINNNFIIPKNWKETTLGEVAEKMYSGGTPSTQRSEFYGGNIPWLRTQEVNFNYIYDTDIKITNEGLNNSSARWIPENTVVVAMYGNSAGRVAFSKIKTTTNQACCNFVANPEKADPLYIYFNLRSRYSEIEGMANGGAQQNLSVGVLKNLEILLPPLPEQQAIAAVLSSLNDKIELLREQNKTLEATAQAIFEEWFANFNFPGATGKMIDSELGRIPEGWKEGKLGDVTDIRGGTTPSTKNYDFWNGDINWTSPKDLSNSKEVFLLQTEKKITNEGLKQISSGLLPRGTLLLSSRAPIGYLAISNLEIAINQGYIGFLPNQYFSNYFMFLWLKINMERVISSANGSTFLEISKSSFKNIDCVIPDINTLQEFNETVDSLFEKILTNILQIQTLSIIRDTLLPKLMRGEIRMNNFTSR